MREIIEILEKIDTDFYNGGITFGQKYDLINSIKKVLKEQKLVDEFKP